MEKLHESTIRLFKALPIESNRTKNPTKEILSSTTNRGFVFSPKVVYNYSDYESLIELVEKEVGLTKERMNNSFHKSWKKVKEAPIEQLVMEQMLHYMTTYGFEQLGIFNEESIYIPCEALEIPELESNKVKLTIIKGCTKEELKEKLLKLLSSGIALKEKTIEDIIEVANFVGIESDDIDVIKNKEVRCILYNKLHIIPDNPTEFIRFVIYSITGSTLIIKDDDTIEKIKDMDKGGINYISDLLFRTYEDSFGLERLAEVFYRFKPIFLALKYNSVMNKRINKIRKLAVKCHKPMKEDYLNTVTGRLKNGETITRKKLDEELSKVNIFRKIRLAYALKYRSHNVDSIMYKVRNGKSWATEFEFKNQNGAKRVYEYILDSIAKDVENNVKGKKLYLPEEIKYSLPATEKQFTGNFPMGTYVEVNENMIVGVNWNNVEGHRIDLDLSMTSSAGKVGWDSSYRDENDTLFSGDITSAGGKNGATELFYVKKQLKNPYILNLNYYNYNETIDVPFKILIAKEKPTNFGGNYMVDPNNLVAVCKTNIDVKQKVIGLVVPTQNKNRFYFAETGLGGRISSGNQEYVTQAREYLLHCYHNSLKLEDILKKTGVKFVNTPEEADIDLSFENLEKDTIINLMVPK
jgi:hypothetical protein